MRIAYDNFIDDIESTDFTVATVDINYPITNVQVQRLSTQYRSIGATSQSIIVDLGTAQKITAAGILGHNISTSATITVSANSTDSWPGATSQTLTGNEGIILKYFAETEYRYWRFDIDDSTNMDGYIAIGRLWLGDYITISPSSLLDFKVTKKRSDSVSYGKMRQKFASIGVGWRKFDFEFPPTEHAMIATINTLFDVVGNHSSFIFCNFDTDRSYILVEPCYCSFTGDIGFVHSNRMKFSYTLTFEEDL